jgi:hypothetical protein
LPKNEIQNSNLKKKSDFGGFQLQEVRKKNLPDFNTWFSVCSQNIQ